MIFLIIICDKFIPIGNIAPILFSFSPMGKINYYNYDIYERDRILQWVENICISVYQAIPLEIVTSNGYHQWFEISLNKGEK